MESMRRALVPRPVFEPKPQSFAQRRPATGLNHSWTMPRLAFDFSAIPVHSRSVDDRRITVSSAPPPQVASPQPKPGEAKLGEIEAGGVKEPIYQSFVPPGLWWLNGATPRLADLYPTTAVLPLADVGRGEFSLKITKGADKIKFDKADATLTGNDLTEAVVTSLAPSKKENDIHIEVQHRAPEQKKLSRAGSVDLTVRAPHHLDLLGTDDRPEGAHGYNSITSLRAFDNIGEPMPYIDVNEDFTTGTLAPGTDRAWGESLATRPKGNTVTHGNAVFQDNYRVSVSGDVSGMSPMPSNPQTPRSTTLTVTFEHDWFVGSTSTGKGVHVSHHIGRFFTDHAEYAAFTSPVATGRRGKSAADTTAKQAAPTRKQAPAAPAGH